MFGEKQAFHKLFAVKNEAFLRFFQRDERKDQM
jgi:hypothetical protein